MLSMYRKLSVGTALSLHYKEFSLLSACEAVVILQRTGVRVASGLRHVASGDQSIFDTVLSGTIMRTKPHSGKQKAI